jgi:ribonuclease HI
VDTKSKKQLFIQGPFAEVLITLVNFSISSHGLGFKKHDSERIIYTDSRTAMSCKKENVNPKLERNEKNKPSLRTCGIVLYNG